MITHCRHCRQRFGPGRRHRVRGVCNPCCGGFAKAGLPVPYPPLRARIAPADLAAITAKTEPDARIARRRGVTLSAVRVARHRARRAWVPA